MGIPAPNGVDAAGKPNAGDQANAFVGGTLSAVGPGKAFAFRGPMNLAIWASIATALTTTASSLAISVALGTGLAAGNAVNSVNVPLGTTLATFSGTTGTLALPTYSYLGILNTVNGQVTLPPGSNVAALLNATVTAASTADGDTIPSGTTVNNVVQNDIAATNTSAGKPGIITLSNVPTAAPLNPNGQVWLQFALAANAVTVTGADSNATFTGPAINYSATVQLERSFDGGATWICCNVGGSGQLAQWATGTPVNITFGEPEKNVLYRLNCIAYTSGTINYRISQTGGAAESLAIGPLSQG
jgi:hypothetical protein